MTEKLYTAPVTERQIHHAKVGNEFLDHGVRMRITRVGEMYCDPRDNRLVFDSWAIEVGDEEQPDAN